MTIRGECLLPALSPREHTLRGAGSSPAIGYHALVAQLVEYRTFNLEAVGPSPTGRTKTKTEGCPATDNPLFHFVVIRNFLRRAA